MWLTEEEALSNPDRARQIREGLQRLAVEIRTHRPPLRVAGPCTLLLSDRINKGMPTLHHLIGGEVFWINDLVVTTDQRRNGSVVSVTIVPKDGPMVMRASPTRIELTELMDKFEGAHAWVEGVLATPGLGRPPPIQQFAEPITERGPAWGTW